MNRRGWYTQRHLRRLDELTIVAGMLSLVLLTLPASPVQKMKLCAWRMAMQLRDGKRVGELCGRFAGSATLAWGTLK